MDRLVLVLGRSILRETLWGTLIIALIVVLIGRWCTWRRSIVPRLSFQQLLDRIGGAIRTSAELTEVQRNQLAFQAAVASAHVDLGEGMEEVQIHH